MNKWPIIKLMHVIYNNATTKIKQGHKNGHKYILSCRFITLKRRCDDKAHAESMQRGKNTIKITIHH